MLKDKITDKKMLSVLSEDEIVCVLASPADKLSILEFGRRFDVGNLTEEEKKRGFLLIHFNEENIENFFTAPSVLAKNKEGDIVGFILTSKLPVENSPPVVKKTLEAVSPYVDLLTRKWVFYGPILVDFVYAGRDLPKKMFEVLLPALKHFEMAFTFIGTSNQTSLHVHLDKLGFKKVTEFEFEGKLFVAVAYDLNKD